MNCIKCGAEIKEPQVFCENCLTEMEQYPVKPNITVTLPNRAAEDAPKKRSRRQKYTKPEDMVRHLRAQRRILVFALVMVICAFAVVSVMTVQLLDKRQKEPEKGQNYGTMASTEPT